MILHPLDLLLLAEEAEEAAAGFLLAAGEGILDGGRSGLLDELGGAAHGLVEGGVLGLVGLAGSLLLLRELGGGLLGLGGGLLVLLGEVLGLLRGGGGLLAVSLLLRLHRLAAGIGVDGLARGDGETGVGLGLESLSFIRGNGCGRASASVCRREFGAFRVSDADKYPTRSGRWRARARPDGPDGSPPRTREEGYRILRGDRPFSRVSRVLAASSGRRAPSPSRALRGFGIDVLIQRPIGRFRGRARVGGGARV